VTEEQLQEVVARAGSKDDVVSWLCDHADTSAYASFSKYIAERSLDHIEDRAAFAKRYPVIERRPDLHYLADVLEADDAEMYPGGRS